MPQEITPLLLASDPSWLPIDIRPLEERLDPDLGFIPGSLSAPLTLDDLSASGPPAWARNPRAVLVCNSGRRSGALVEALRDRFGLAVRHLPSGVLGWRAAGFPAAGTDDLPATHHPIPPGTTVRTFPRVLASCFVGQLVETALSTGDLDDSLDPLAMFRQCFAAESVPWDAPSRGGLYRVLDRAAMTARVADTPLPRVCANLNWALRALQSLPD